MSEITSKTDIEPRLLSTDQLKHHLINKGVSIENTWSRDDLINAYIKYILPKPQRNINSNRLKASDNSLNNVCSITRRITLDDEKMDHEPIHHHHHHHHTLIGDIRASLHHHSQSTSNPSSEDKGTTSPTKKIVLKRSRLGTTHDNKDDDDTIKKTRMN